MLNPSYIQVHFGVNIIIDFISVCLVWNNGWFRLGGWQPLKTYLSKPFLVAPR